MPGGRKEPVANGTVAEVTAPILAGAPQVQRVLRRGNVVVYVRSSKKSGSLRADATLVVGRRKLWLGRLKTTVTAGRRERLRVRLRPRARRLLERALSSDRHPRVTLRRGRSGARRCRAPIRCRRRGRARDHRACQLRSGLRTSRGATRHGRAQRIPTGPSSVRSVFGVEPLRTFAPAGTPPGGCPRCPSLGAERGSITRPRELRQQPARTGDLLRRQARQRVLKRLTRQQPLEAIDQVRAAARPPACAVAGGAARARIRLATARPSCRSWVSSLALPGRSVTPTTHLIGQNLHAGGTRARPSPAVRRSGRRAGGGAAAPATGSCRRPR